MNYWERQRQIEKRNTIITICIVCFVIIAITVSLYFVFRTREAHYRVIGAQWITTTNIRQKTLDHDSDWCPPDQSSAFNIRRERRLYKTYDCNCITVGGDEYGAGGVEICSTCRDYRDYCTYDYWAWPVIKSKSNSGKPEFDPVYPVISFEPPNQKGEMLIEFPVVWRNEEGKSEKYKARNLQELREYYIGEWWAVDVNHAGKFQPREKLFGEQ